MSRLVMISFVVLATIAFHGVAADKDWVEEFKEIDVFRLRTSNSACPVPIVGTQCPGDNPLFYFKCCGELSSNCCFRLQDWLTVLLAVLAVLIVISIVVNFIRCLFCY